jgi:hypothetical protein
MEAMKASMSLFLVVVLAVAVWPAPAASQSRALQERLKGATRVECEFSQIAKGDWRDDGEEFTTEATKFSADFFDIDIETGTAEAEQRFGASYIIVRYAEGYLHFMQSLNSGPLYVTTILAQETTDGRLKAVHTRHEYTQISLPGFTSRPEMYLGTCMVE